MIRGNLVKALIFIFICQTILSRQFNDIEIESVEKSVTLSGQYPSDITKINFKALEDGISHFYYALPTEYDEKVAKLAFFKSARDKSYLSYTKSSLIYDGIPYAIYKVKLHSNINVGQTGQLHLQGVYINRYVNLPSSIALSQDQKLQYSDIKFLTSPYKIKEQEISYKMTKIIQSDSDGEKKGMSQVIFRKQNTEPFFYQKHIVFGVNNNPQVIFTSVEKVIDVSHWGNVAIVENYKIVNTGPTLKGEFSRVNYGSRGQSDAKNSYKGIDFDLPYEIHGLYYLDEVGNITTSKAYRDDSSQTVKVSLQPRFALLGGWKSNWQLGYNFHTKNHLFNSGNKFSLKNIKVEYALERIITQQFTLKVILPQGVTNVQIKIGGEAIDMSQVHHQLSKGYLDFNGRPTFIISNYKGLLKDRNIEIDYDFSESQVYKKPLLLGLIIFCLLAVSIFAQRFQLEAFATSKLE